MDSISQVVDEALGQIEAASSAQALRELESSFIGKNGKIGALLKQIGSLPPAEKPLFGQKVNEAKAKVSEALEARGAALQSSELADRFAQEKIDVTMPGARIRRPVRHVLDQAAQDVKKVFSSLGFEYLESPDIEEFRYNFDALNYPPDHPAMDDQDTFYLDDEYVLRTQTTALQGRVFETRRPPLRVFTIGRCYRNEAVDRTHGHTFTQVDAFMVDEGVSMAHLRGTLTALTKTLFGLETTTRFRPDFFPFVEPGVDFAISTPKFRDGAWLELGGAGLIHPNILEAYGIDTNRYSGFAFGLGIERMPMLRYGIEDLRHFFDNDLRFLGQFN